MGNGAANSDGGQQFAGDVKKTNGLVLDRHLGVLPRGQDLDQHVQDDTAKRTRGSR